MCTGSHLSKSSFVPLSLGTTGKMRESKPLRRGQSAGWLGMGSGGQVWLRLVSGSSSLLLKA